MTTTPTQLPVPSEKPQDLKFNAGKIDEFVTSDSHDYIDRLGGKHRTIAGIDYSANQAMINYGYITKKSFEIGATLDTPNTVLQWESNGEYYRWDGDWSQPKVVPPDSTPDNAGGVGKGKWVGVGDASLRSDLKETTKVFDNLNIAKSASLQDVFGLIITKGRINAGDGGGGSFYRNGTGAPGETDGGSYFITANGSKFTLSEPANIKQFGAVPGGNFNSALTTYLAYASTGDKVLRFRSAGVTTMAFTNIVASMFDGYTLDVDSTITISASDDSVIKSPLVNVVRPVHFFIENLKFDYWLRPDAATRAGVFSSSVPANITNLDVTTNKKFFVDIEEKEQQILRDFTSADWRCVTASWAAGAFTPLTPTSIDATQATVPINNGNLVGMLFSKFTIGEEVSTSFFPDNMANAWTAAVVECDGYRYALREQPNSIMKFMATAIGGSPAESDIDYVGRGTHGSQWIRNSVVSIRIDGPRAFSIIVNGIVRVSIGNTVGVIKEVGFCAVGLVATTESLGLFFPYSIRNRTQRAAKALNIMAVGDSITDAAVSDGWSVYMNQMLEGCHGIRVGNIRTVAVPGYNTTQIKPLYDAESLAGYDIIVFQIGVNDIQGQVIPGTVYTNMYNMIKRANDIGIRCIVSIPTQYYGQVQAQAITGTVGRGQNTSNYDKGGVRRAAIIRAALIRNNEVGYQINMVNTGSLEDLGPIVAEYLANNKDSIVADNIHPTSYGRLLLGMSNAKAVASHMFGKTNQVEELTSVSWGANGWSTITTNPLRVRVEPGLVTFFGNISSNASPTTVDGTIIANIPKWMAPIRTKRFVIEKQNDVGATGGMANISIDSNGAVRIYGVAAYNVVMDNVTLFIK